MGVLAAAAAPAAEAYVAGQVPSHDVTDPVTRDWAAREFRQLAAYALTLEERIGSLEAAVLELAARLEIVEADAWDRA